VPATSEAIASVLFDLIRPGLPEHHELFGKGTNPFGHGHSFHVRVSVRVGGPEDAQALARGMDHAARTVTGQLHHRRLELEVPFVRDHVATSENVALWI
jgi:6-pyruvoyl-tetrahydropterin synthase